MLFLIFFLSSFVTKRKKQILFLLFLLIFNGVLEFLTISSIIPLFAISNPDYLKNKLQ